jgi:hypothetical protein
VGKLSRKKKRKNIVRVVYFTYLRITKKLKNMGMFKTKTVFTEDEKQYESIITKLLEDKTTKKQLKIKIGDTICVLVNHEKDTMVKLDSVGIILKIKGSIIKNRLSDKIVEHLKDMIVEFMNTETDEYIKEIDAEEFKIITDINETL